MPPMLPLALIVAVEGLLILLLMALNAYFFLQRPIQRHLRQIYFVHGTRFRTAWYLVLVASTFLVASQVVNLLTVLGRATPESVARVELALQFFFTTLVTVAFAIIFGVFARYVRRIPANPEELESLVQQDLRGAILREEEPHATLDLSHVGDVYTGRKRLGPYVSLTHYRALMSGFTQYTEERLGALAEALLYSVGRLSARGAMTHILQEVPDKERAMHRIFDEIRANGIAIPELVDRTPERIEVRLHENVSSAGAQPQGKPICHYQSGMLAGLFEVLTGRHILAHELKCWGLGDRYCEFQLELGKPLHPVPAKT